VGDRLADGSSQAKRVIAVYWNDLIAVGDGEALKQKGYTSDTAIAAAAMPATPLSR